MELDGNINNKENIREISEKRLEEIKQEYPNFMQFYTINDYKKIEQLMNENNQSFRTGNYKNDKRISE